MVTKTDGNPELKAKDAFAAVGVKYKMVWRWKNDPDFKRRYESIMASRTHAQRGKNKKGVVHNPTGKGGADSQRIRGDLGRRLLQELREAFLDPGSPLSRTSLEDLCLPKEGVRTEKEADKNKITIFSKVLPHIIIKERVQEITQTVTHSVDTASIEELRRKSAQLDKANAPLLEAYDSTKAMEAQFRDIENVEVS